jgi:hypothetical protein
MNKFMSIIPIMLLCGCAEVGQIATKVITDPNVIALAKATGEAVKTAAVMSNPEIAAIAVAGAALVTAVSALLKKSKQTPAQ